MVSQSLLICNVNALRFADLVYERIGAIDVKITNGCELENVNMVWFLSPLYLPRQEITKLKFYVAILAKFANYELQWNVLTIDIN